MISNLSHPISKRRRLVLVGTLLLVSIVALALALWSRWAGPESRPLSLDEFTGFEFNPYVFGYFFQSYVIAALLIYLFTTTRLVRRILSRDVPVRGDRLKLFGGLVLVQLLVVAFDLGRFLVGGEPFTAVPGLLVVITAGLLGGWRLGLGLGLVTMLARGTQQLVLFFGAPLAGEIQHLFEMDGLEAVVEAFPWAQVLLQHYVWNLWAFAAVWAGLAAGLCAELLGERRFAPLAAFGLGAGIDLGAGYLTAIAGIPPGVLFSIPSALISGVATAAVALMVRSVQAEAARRRAETAQLALAQAELRALRAQINPHFLFNALNTIRYFVRTDPEAARRLLLDLSEVFQRALRSGEMVPLQDELSYVEAYLALEKARLDERLRVTWDLPDGTEAGQAGSDGDESLLEQPVPTLILQPIVENAILHGIANRTEGGLLRIRVSRDGNGLLLEVFDDGPGISPERLAEVLGPETGQVAPEPAGGRPSIGLQNVDGRLRALYGPEYRLKIVSELGHGTQVQIRIPLGG